MCLNLVGQIVHRAWTQLPSHFEHVELDQFVVMPNHFHAIVWIVAEVGRHDAADVEGVPQRPDWHGTDAGSLGAIVQNFKSVTSRKINAFRRTPGAPVWQRNYWEKVIRNDRALDAIRTYIAANPQHRPHRM